MFMCSITSKEKKYCGGCFVPSHQGLLEKLDSYRVFLCVTQLRYKYDVVYIYNDIYT